MVKQLRVNSVENKINKYLFHRLISLLKTDLGFKIESLMINFVESEYLLKLNNEFLGHNYLTDIITFDYSKKKDLFDAELYISVQDASRNAKKYHSSLEQELMRLVIHGVLHILGYDDKSPKKRAVMKALENRLTNKYLFILR